MLGVASPHNISSRQLASEMNAPARVSRAQSNQEDAFYTPMSYETYDLRGLVSNNDFNINDLKAPESEPYHLKYAEDIFVDPERLTIYEQIDYYTQPLQNLFKRYVQHNVERGHKDQFSLLSNFLNGSEVRVTRNFKNQGERLYTVFDSALCRWTGFNMIRGFYLEGTLFTRFELGNLVKIAELTPKIFTHRAQKIYSQYAQQLDASTRKAAALLEDGHYENTKYLVHLHNELITQWVDFRTHAIGLELENEKFSTTQMQDVRKKLSQFIENAQKRSSWFVDYNKYYGLEELTFSLGEIFKKISSFSTEVRKSYISESDLLIPAKGNQQYRVEELREKIRTLVCDLHKAKKSAFKVLEETQKYHQVFEDRRKYLVRF